MISLTEEQKNALLQLGGTTCLEMISSDVLNEFLSLRIIHKRPDGKLDLTETGEQAYKQLIKKQKREHIN
jgi:hypothetical protein